MKTKTPLLLALLVPGLASLAACDRNDAATDDAAPPPAAMTDPAPVETMPAETPAPAPAPTPAGDEMTFAQLDRNGDGGVGMDELTPADMLHQHFSVADADGNGALSEAEILQHRADMAGDTPR